jgi:H+/Cl- antiporter ClcA
MSISIYGTMISLCVAGSFSVLIQALTAGKIPLRGGRVFSRADTPARYWWYLAFLTVCLVLAILALYWLVSMFVDGWNGRYKLR